jgi:hypothetical protein
LVVVDVIGFGIVGHDQIQPAVVIKIHPTHGEAVVELFVDNTRLSSDVAERAVAVVAEQEVRGALHSQRSAGHPHAEKRAERLPGIVGRSAHTATIVARTGRGSAGCRTLRGPIFALCFFARLTGRRWIIPIEFDIAGHVEVQASIAIVIAEGAPGCPQVHQHPRLRGDVGEAPVAVVMVQTAFAEVDDVQIRPAVIVVIPCADSRTPAVILEPGLGGDVAEGAVAVVAKQGGR